MNKIVDLPPGQREINTLPRFGMTMFANRFPTQTEEIAIDVSGDVEKPIRISTNLSELNRVDQVSDFHCVTTWTKRNVSWSGFRFVDFYNELVLSQARPRPDATQVLFRGQDGYRVGMPLGDLLAPEVLLADRMDGQRLPVANGAPLRLVAPAHYGYKNAKHISRIDFVNTEQRYRSGAFQFMDHPRARVEHEERGTIFPGWMLRYLYRPLINPTRRKFKKTLAEHLAGKV